MAKRKRNITENEINKKIASGHGCGRKSKYKTWLKIHDVASLGRSTRMLGWKTQRIHHCLSDLERNYLLLLDWSDKVIDIREQFPLLPLEQTLQISEEMGIKHPKDPKTRTPVVMTTDFLVTTKAGDHVVDIARTLKYSKDLNSLRTLEKFQIEKIYWEKKGINWGVVTELDIPKVMAENIRHIRQSYFVEDDFEFHGKDLNILCQYLIQKLYRTCHCQSVSEIVDAFDYEFGFECGIGLKLFKYLLARKYILTDMTNRLNFNKVMPLSFPTVWSKDRETGCL